MRKVLCLLLITSLAAVVRATPLDDVATVKQRFKAHIIPAQAADIADVTQAAQTDLGSQRADGTWADINYADQSSANWATSVHLLRLVQMAVAYNTPGSTLQGSAPLKAGILNGLTYWEAKDYQNPNWWWNQIGVPQLVGEVMLLMQDSLSAYNLSKGITILSRSTFTAGNGENTVWPASNTVMRGCLQNDPTVVTSGYAGIYGEIRYNPGGEGLQPDWSFHQHGALLYNGGYGYAFGNDVARFASFAEGTSFQVSANARKILDGYLLDGQQWMVRGVTFDFSAVGREITRQGKLAAPLSWSVGPISPVGAAYGLGNAVALQAAGASPRAAEYAAFSARMKGLAGAPPLVGNRSFWWSDDMVHSRAGYLASVRAFSNRTINAEYVNGEGGTTHHIADGASFLYRSGNEYRDIFPLWDWEKVPGTTVETGLGFTSPVRTTTTASFVGGTSDGLYGVAAMDLLRNDIQAHKSWFFFDNEYACLGAGITCSTAHGVVTTLNQCWVNGPIAASTQASSLPRGETLLTNASWVAHNGVGYVFPSPTAVHVKAETRTGAWSSIGAGSSAPVSGDVFTLWIDHGIQPSGAAYAYVVLPGADAAHTAAWAAAPTVEVLSNTPALQAVRNNALGIVEAVFWAKGTMDGGPGWTVSADQPCAAVLRETPDGMRVAVSNPNHALLRVNLDIDRPLYGPGCTPYNGGTRIAVYLSPTIPYGSSLVLDLVSPRALDVAGGLAAAGPGEAADFVGAVKSLRAAYGL